MSPGARILSFDALDQLREAWQRFSSAAQNALEGSQAEVRRSIDALEKRLQFWQHEIRRMQDQVHRAKSELAQRRWGQRDGGGPGTTDQELALARAQRRLKEAEEKEQTARRWLRHLPKEIQEYEGPVRQLSGFLHAELNQAVVLLQNKSAALEAYAQTAALKPSPPTEAKPHEP